VTAFSIDDYTTVTIADMTAIRCHHCGRCISSPVVDPDGNLFEHTIYHPATDTSIGELRRTALFHHRDYHQ
jgi:hypothetical protein